MKKFLILMLLTLILIPTAAMAEISFPKGLTVIEDEAFYAADLDGVLRLPDGIEQVGDYAFADTSLDGLIIPASCRQVGKSVLWRARADYLYLESADTVLLGDPVSFFVFAPTGSSALAGTDLYDFPTESLTVVDGVYYTVADNARPLCAVERKRLGETVTIPKLVNGKPVTTLFLLCTEGWDHVQEVRIPAYLADTSPIAATTYETMSIAAPVPSVAAPIVGETITWTTQTEGAYGTVTYHWTINVNGESYSDLTIVPEYTFTPSAAGEITVSVRAQDAVGDSAQATGTPVTVTNGIPQYRALLIGNTYPGEYAALAGPDNDLRAMKTMLSSMKGTPYQITSAENRTADGIRGAIATTFAEAQPGDVSLFYYSGHGTAQGALVGTNGSYLSVYGLRTALEKIPGIKIVILDCCYSGASINKSAGTGSVNLNAFNQAIISGLTAKTRSSENLADQGFIVLTACRKDQESVSLSGGSHYWGAFTYGLCYGSGYDEWNLQSLSGLPADQNGDGAITLGEAYHGVLERIQYLNNLFTARSRTLSQTPGEESSDTQESEELLFVQQVTQYYGDTNFVLWSR